MLLKLFNFDTHDCKTNDFKYVVIQYRCIESDEKYCEVYFRLFMKHVNGLPNREPNFQCHRLGLKVVSFL